MRCVRLVVLVLVLILVACESDDGGRGSGSSNGDVALDASADVEVSVPADTSDVTPSEDAAADVPPEPDDAAPSAELQACLDELAFGETLELLPEAPDSQIHAAMAFDGRGVWLALNVPEEESSGFDVWATRLDCAGRALVAPFKVNDDAPGNDIDPDIAVSGDRVLIVWQRDTGGDPNLFVRYRVFSTAGDRLMESDAALSLRSGGETWDVSAWMSRVTGLPGGGFALSGSVAHPELERFQAFTQAMEGEGAVTPAAGGLTLAQPMPQVSQVDPDVQSDAGGGLALAWTSTPDEGASRVGLARWRSLGDSPDLTRSPEEGASKPDLALGVGEGAPLFLAYAVEGYNSSEVVLTDVEWLGEEGAPRLSFGHPSAYDHTPTLATAPGGGAVMWYRVRGGIRNDAWLQRFTGGDMWRAEGVPLLLNPAGPIDDHATPPIYGPALIHLHDHLYLAAWSEGQSPNFRLVGRFVQL
jgi:hypothetical protein